MLNFQTPFESRFVFILLLFLFVFTLTVVLAILTVANSSPTYPTQRPRLYTGFTFEYPREESANLDNRKIRVLLPLSPCQ